MSVTVQQIADVLGGCRVLGRQIKSMRELDDIALTFPADWIAQHPLTWQELKQQTESFRRLGLSLELS